MGKEVPFLKYFNGTQLFIALFLMSYIPMHTFMICVTAK